jgi:hypothetical protein
LKLRILCDQALSLLTAFQYGLDCVYKRESTTTRRFSYSLVPFAFAFAFAFFVMTALVGVVTVCDEHQASNYQGIIGASGHAAFVQVR